MKSHVCRFVFFLLVVSLCSLSALATRQGTFRSGSALSHKDFHLALHEDFSKVTDDDPTPRPVVHEFRWKLGTVDGEDTGSGQRNQPRRGNDRRDRSDDEDRGRRGRDDDRSNNSWRDRLRRSLSRSTRDQGNDRRDDRRDRERDRFGSRDGHRRAADHGVDSSNSPSPAAPDDMRVTSMLEGHAVAYTAATAPTTDAGRTVTTAAAAAQAAPTDATRDWSPTNPGSPVRGRSPARNSGAAARRCSQASRTPPSSPSSPTSVIPTPPPSARKVPSPVMVLHSDLSDRARAAVRTLAPPRLVAPLPSRPTTPDRPPGFEDSPAAKTPLLISASPQARTPTPAVAAPPDLSAIFKLKEPPLLPPPASPRPTPPTSRRRTLALTKPGFSLRRSSTRLKAKKRATPVAVMAEKLICRRLGIVNETDQVTEQAISEFTRMFKNQLPSTAIAALRALFRLDCDHAATLEDALIAHGGQGALDHDDDDTPTAATAG